MNRFLKRIIVVVVLAGLVGLGVVWSQRRSVEKPTVYRTAAVTRGDIASSISATGTVEPEEVVDVGAQVAGKIVSFGQDRDGATIDYGSTVEEGTVLAKIDDSLYSADVAQVRAQLDQAKAGVRKAEADLGQMQARLNQAERDWNRAKKLGASEALSQSDYDASESGYEVAKANLAVGKAAIVQAQNNVTQIEATLRRSLQNLDYCTIKSPVRGVIIDRRVNTGQTVVSSLNAPSLFLIARDLRRMQVWVSVNEADIGHIRTGQQVSFTVDAYPGMTFSGEVGKIRLNASMTQNVVTYTVEVNTDNSNGKLLPYLTANANFLVSEHQGVLLVPAAALRFSPPAAEDREESPGRRPEGGAQPAPAEGFTRGALWTQQDGRLQSIPVEVGISDGTTTEVRSPELKEGIPVIIGEEIGETAGPAPGGSPFTPRIFGNRGGSRGGHGPGAGPGH